MRKVCLGLAICCSVALPGCETQPTQQQTGMVVGGVLGGVLGSQIGGGSGSTAGAIVGSLVGAFVGGAVGRSMDDRDRKNVAYALEHEPSGASSQWRNPDTGHQYSVVPTRTYASAAGAPCREYTVNGNIGGKREKIYGTACRQPDGSWRNVNN